VRHAGFGHESQDVVVAELAAAQDDGAGDFDLVVAQEQDEIDRRVFVVGELLREVDADGHFDVAREAQQDFAHQHALTLRQRMALAAVERGNREIDIVAAVGLRVDREFRQAMHLAQILCR
jgi:deoxyribose-phosphate aldolase